MRPRRNRAARPHASEIVEFSPTAELNRTMEVIGRNLAQVTS
ncbi:hypothetical protein [Streptomyces diastatochromogenes]